MSEKVAVRRLQGFGTVQSLAQVGLLNRHLFYHLNPLLAKVPRKVTMAVRPWVGPTEKKLL